MIEKIKEVLTSFTVDYQPIEPEKDGYVGPLKVGSRATIRVSVSPERDDIYAFLVQDGKDEKKKVISKRNLAVHMRPPRDGKIYELRVPIEESRSALISCTMSNTNNMSLLQLSPNGNFQMWKVVLISQGGDFFLVVQKTYKGRCYRDGDEIICPQFDERFEARKDKEWSSMIDFFSGLLADKVKDLSPITKYKPEPEITTDDLKPNTGIVLFWAPDSQTGAIKMSEKSGGEVVSAHRSQVPKRPRLRYLIQGEIVQIKKLDLHPQNSRHPSEFKHKAIGIKPIS